MPKTPEGEVRKWFLKELKKEFGPKIYIQINHQSRYTSRGIPDITLCILGVVLWVELKSATGKLSDLQRIRMAEIRAAGGHATTLIGKDAQKFSRIVQFIRSKAKLTGGSNGRKD